MPIPWVQPVELRNPWVRLEPISEKHAGDLSEVATQETFQYFVTLQPASCDETGMRDFIERSLLVPRMLCFATIDARSGRAVGMTSYLDIRDEHKGLEIGYTWIGSGYRQSHINPAAKFLLLEHAFETLGALRVQLKTDARNAQSQRAIEKLGARKEGMLRSHFIMADGFVRDTVMYSILPSEWPAVKASLLERLRS